MFPRISTIFFEAGSIDYLKAMLLAIFPKRMKLMYTNLRVVDNNARQKPSQVSTNGPAILVTVCEPEYRTRVLQNQRSGYREHAQNHRLPALQFLAALTFSYPATWFSYAHGLFCH